MLQTVELAARVAKPAVIALLGEDDCRRILRRVEEPCASSIDDTVKEEDWLLGGVKCIIGPDMPHLVDISILGDDIDGLEL